MCNSEYQIQKIQIPNYPKPKCQFKPDNRIWFMSCLQALLGCLATDFLFVKGPIAYNDSKSNTHTPTQTCRKLRCIALQ